MHTDIMKISGSLLTISDKMEYMEGKSRCNNLVNNGIQESPGETWVDSARKVRRIPVEKLQLHTGQPVGGNNRPRSMEVKVLRYKDKQAALQKPGCLKGT